MNIFFIHKEPRQAARWQCDKHVVKMILESAQMLSTVLRANGVEDDDCPVKLYRSTHAKHPSTLWAGETRTNYEWLCTHALELCAEYTRRYDRRHASQDLLEWCPTLSHRIPAGDLTKFAVAIADKYKPQCIVEGDPVASYRNYYTIIKPAVISVRWKDPATKPPWGIASD